MAVRIGLINPKMEGPYPPLGLGYIAGYLRKYGAHEYDIRIFDGNAHEDVRKGIEEFNPHIVGFTGHSPQVKEAVRLSNALREWRGGVLQVIGGVHISAVPEQTLKRGSFDIAVIGEGERAFLEIVDAYIDGAMKTDAVKKIRGTAFMEGGRMVSNERMPQIENLDEIPHPARDLFNMDYYLGLSFGVRGTVKTAVTSITSSRGCPYNCSFCGVNIVFKKVRQFSREYCISEVTELAQKFGVRALYFADDTFIVNKKGVVKFCENLIRTGLSKKISWTAQARANLIDWDDMETLKLMKAAGCIQLEYGFESGSDHVLGLLKQNKVTVEDNQRAIDVTHKSGLRVLGTFIVGTPGERTVDLDMTKRFIEKNMKKLDYFQAFICTPYPGSPLYEICAERGLVEADYFAEIERRGKVQVPVFTDTLPHELVRETLKYLDYLGLKKVKLTDKIVWVVYHLFKGSKDVSHHDKLYIFRRLVFYFVSLLRFQKKA